MEKGPDMSDNISFPKSVSPSLILIQFIQELERLIISSQKQINLLKDSAEAQQKQQITQALCRDMTMLVQLHHSVNDYLKAFEANLQKNVEDSSIQLLKVFIHEARHVISSMEGYMDIMQRSESQEMRQKALKQLYLLLQTMSDMHNKLSQLVNER